MKFLKNVLLIALCIMLVLPTLPAFAATTVVYDDFESYEVTDKVVQNTASTAIGGPWVLQQNGNLLSTPVTSGIMEYNGSKKLVVTGITTYPTQYLNRQNYVKYAGDRTGIGNSVRYKFHFENDSQNNGFGIRIMLDETMGSFYSLWFTGNKELTSNFTPFKDGQYGLWTFYKSDMSLVVNSEEKIKSAAASIESADVELIMVGGNFSWTIDGTLEDGSSYHATGSAFDPNPLKVVETTHEGFFATNGSSNETYVDNFSIEVVQEYKDFAPSDSSLKNVADGDNTVALDGNYIRKIYLPAAANSTVALDMDGNAVNASFDAEGWWTYLGDIQTASVLTIPDTYDCANMIALVDAGEDYNTFVFVSDSKRVFYPMLGGSMDPTTMNWTSSDEKIATVDANGVVTGVKRGSVIVSAEKNGIEFSCTVNIKGELDTAIDDGTLDAYIADKKPVIDAFNAATTKEEMKAVLTGNTSTSLSYIKDIDWETMDTLLLDDADWDAFAHRLVSYGDISWSKAEDLDALQNLLDVETFVGVFDNVTDLDTMKAYVDITASVLGLENEHFYYLKYQDEAATFMLNQAYDNVADLKDTMEEGYVMAAFNDSMAYSMIQDILTKCEDEIGYDDAKLAQNGITNVAKYLLDNKADITTRAQLKAAVDGYVAPVVDGGSDGIGGSSSSVGSSGGSSGGFGGGLGGGGSVYTGGNSYGADQDLVQDAAQLPIVDDEPLFADVDAEDWFFEAVAMLKGKGIVNGYEDNTFAPDASVTRAEFVKMLIGVLEIAPVEPAAPAEGEEAAPAAAVFTDVAEADWHYGYMMAAYENGLIYGDENGAANPDALITREEMATMIQRAMNLKAVPFESVNKGQVFTDDAAISDWAYSAVIAVKNAGIINGYADGSFRPADNATRAESAQVLSGFATTLDAAIEAAEAAAAQAAAEAEA